jgi:hypothetical protein
MVLQKQKQEPTLLVQVWNSFNCTCHSRYNAYLCNSEMYEWIKVGCRSDWGIVGLSGIGATETILSTPHFLPNHATLPLLNSRDTSFSPSQKVKHQPNRSTRHCTTINRTECSVRSISRNAECVSMTSECV